MAEEPQPETVPPKGSTEDRKAAAALSNLEVSHDHDEDDATKKPSSADTAALSNAVSNLRVVDDEGSKGVDGKQTVEESKVKKVKIDQADVAFLVGELDLSKTKATDLLKAHGGDRKQAVRAYILPVR